ncbi:MAG: hypothetical protein K9H49_07220 [Bacteroidales bacterium]|nr:hypothetical protein [Bacteroidales bacterium]MCF8390302.1 hypothetical protein [Bacteroidales bacterium]
MKKILFLTAFLLAFHFTQAQDVVLEKDVSDQYKGTKGPNMRHFKHFYLGLGTILDFDEEAGSAINPLKSNQFIVGRRYKLKLASFYSIGYDINFKINKYGLIGEDQDTLKPYNPLAVEGVEEKHSLSSSALGMDVYMRFNMGKRGNKLGKYVDLGFSGQWNITNVQEYTLINNDDPYVGKSRIINRRLSFVEPFSYGPTARIGFNKVSVYGYYRLSDHFKSSFNMAELPRLSVGMQLALF